MKEKSARKRISIGRGKKPPSRPKFAPQEGELSEDESYAIGITKALTKCLKIDSLERRKAVYYFVRCLQVADFHTLSASNHLRTSIEALGVPLE